MKPRSSALFDRKRIGSMFCIAAAALGWSAPIFAGDLPVTGSLTGSIVIPSQFKSGPTPGGQVGVSVSSPADASPWWSVFGDAVLNRLEEQALFSNQDLQGAVARVIEARAAASAAASGLYPQVTAPLLATRERTTNTGPITTSRLIGSGFFPTIAGTTFPSTFSGQALSNTYNDFQVPLAVGYEIDVFGRIQHAYHQARANAEASLADRQGVKLSLTAQVASNYFALRAADSEMAVLQRTARLRTDAEQVQSQRVKGGTASDVDLLRARVETANTEADLVDVAQERAELENALAELCGQSASGFHLEPKPLDELAPPGIPATIPAQLLSQRPDLVEAERRIAATNEGIKAARAQFYPAINVQGGYGFESSQANQLLENQSHTWSIVGAINIPIFDGGRNAADLKMARARNEQAFDAYRETALKAFREVEDALSNLRQRALQADARKRAAGDAQRVFDASQRSYGQGGLSYFEVIDSERVLLNAELSQVRTLSNRYAATVDLIRALGGGFGKSLDDPN
jgi:multidrug efflux system outer membrane protein